MYPLLRLLRQLYVHRNAAPLGPFDTHVCHLRCWPNDIDMWWELNNGRTLTLYDLGRIVMFKRIGVVDVMRERGWTGTVAGASVRYRARVTAFDRLEMRSRVIGWDARFLYVEQGMWREGTCTSHVLVRTAVVGGGKLVPMTEAGPALGALESPPLPDWVRAWAEADAERPWPPMA